MKKLTVLLGILLILCSSGLKSQVLPTSVTVDGQEIKIRTSGLEERKLFQPMVILVP